MTETAPQKTETELATTGDLKHDEWGMMKEQAAMLIKTGFIPPALNTAEKVIAVMLTARELQIGRMEALRSINIIQGKPCASVQLMLALAQRTREMEKLDILEDDDGAHVTVKRKNLTAYTSHFGPEQAKSMGLEGKDNYKKQAATMYKWRALAEALRFTFPDAICGVYMPEELGAEVTITPNGDVVLDPDKQPVAAKTVEAPEVETVKIQTEPGLTDQDRRTFWGAMKRHVPEEEAQRKIIKSVTGVESTAGMTLQQADMILGAAQDYAKAAKRG